MLSLPAINIIDIFTTDWLFYYTTSYFFSKPLAAIQQISLSLLSSLETTSLTILSSSSSAASLSSSSSSYKQQQHHSYYYNVQRSLTHRIKGFFKNHLISSSSWWMCFSDKSSKEVLQHGNRNWKIVLYSLLLLLTISFFVQEHQKQTLTSYNTIKTRTKNTFVAVLV